METAGERLMTLPYKINTSKSICLPWSDVVSFFLLIFYSAFVALFADMKSLEVINWICKIAVAFKYLRVKWHLNNWISLPLPTTGYPVNLAAFIVTPSQWSIIFLKLCFKFSTSDDGILCHPLLKSTPDQLQYYTSATEHSKCLHIYLQRHKVKKLMCIQGPLSLERGGDSVFFRLVIHAATQHPFRLL